MKIKKLLILITIFSFIIITISCSTDTSEEYWFLNSDEQFDTSKPWWGQVHLTTSPDGVSFTKGNLLSDHSGVPHLLKTSDGRLIASYQYFDPFDDELFDVFAYKISEDNGITWSDQQYIQITGFDREPNFRNGSMPVDPTLVELEDGSFRLYFTFHDKNQLRAHLSSATSKSLHQTFQYEGPLLTSEHENILDPAVIYFQDQWHHFTWTEDKNSQGYTKNIHSTSPDGLTFTRQADIYLPMNMLGQAIVIDDQLYFYGTGLGGLPKAVSGDGFNWEMSDSLGIFGADPGIAMLDDTTFLMIYTSQNFN
jgi:hypothetical protein